jgi:hypothetical protein
MPLGLVTPNAGKSDLHQPHLEHQGEGRITRSLTLRLSQLGVVHH